MLDYRYLLRLFDTISYQNYSTIFVVKFIAEQGAKFLGLLWANYF
jgi:hypothetical protein